MASVDQITDDVLRGQPFIGKNDEEGHSRVCKNCIYGVIEVNNPSGIEYAGECLTTGPQKLFKVDTLPAILDGKQVGNYCPSFEDHTRFEEI